MKKLLLASAVALVASSAIASENTFYFRADAGAAFMPKATFNGNKGKRTNHVVADLGVGTYIMDNVRVELDLANSFNAKQKFSTATASDTAKINAISLHFKALVDIFDYGYGKAFVGAGAGMTQLSGKTTDLGKAKKKNSVNFLGTAGTSFDVSEGVMLDVAYSYVDHGKTKNFGTTTNKLHYKTHNLTAGVRVEL